MTTLAAVAKIADALPGVTVGARWNNKTWLVGDRGFLWQRPLSKADLKRYGDAVPPRGDLVAVMVDGLDAKDALLAMALPGFFTIPHFVGYPAILIELRLARLADVRAVVTAAHRDAAARPPVKAKKEKKKAKKKAK